MRDFTDIANRLRERGVALRPPATRASMGRLEERVGHPLSKMAIDLFSTFDGFDSQRPDDATMVCLWSTDAITANIEESETSIRGHIIGDYFLDAEFLRCRLDVDAPEVWWNERDELAAPDLLDFCRRIADGSFRA